MDTPSEDVAKSPSVQHGGRPVFSTPPDLPHAVLSLWHLASGACMGAHWVPPPSCCCVTTFCVGDWRSALECGRVSAGRHAGLILEEYIADMVGVVPEGAAPCDGPPPAEDGAGPSDAWPRTDGGAGPSHRDRASH